MMVCLSSTDDDASLVQYAGMPAGLDALEEVRFVHVVSGSRESNEVTDYAQERIESAVARSVGATWPNTRIRCDVLSGPLLDRLIQYAAEEQIDLLMVGHRLSQPRRGALGRRLAMKAPCSVWMVPDGTAPSIKKILVPCDFSRHSSEAATVAISLAKVVGAECLALYVYLNESRAEYEEYEGLVRGHEDEVLAKFLAPLDDSEVEITPVFAEGMDVADVIQREAEQRQVDMVVMSTRGRSPSAAILLGSVTEQVIIDSSVPLLAVKHQGAQLNALQALLGGGPT
jgi:nucleotide-binding universal stress UspA family protein